MFAPCAKYNHTLLNKIESLFKKDFLAKGEYVAYICFPLRIETLIFFVAIDLEKERKWIPEREEASNGCGGASNDQNSQGEERKN